MREHMVSSCRVMSQSGCAVSHPYGAACVLSAFHQHLVLSIVFILVTYLIDTVIALSLEIVSILY